ncbi:hypothetical protein GGI21_003622, partial [Coemansia aciculifera]
MSTSVDDSWVVVDKTASGGLRAKASHESLYTSSDDECEAGGSGSGGVIGRLHMQSSESAAGGPSAELLSWLSESPNEDNSGEGSKRTSSFRTNSSHRSSTCSTTEAASSQQAGTFVARVVEVRQVGASRPMNVQCAASVGDERFVIPHVMTRPRDHETWSARMDDTFVFDVRARQFTFNLSVYATPHAPPAHHHRLPQRLSMAARRHVGRSSLACDSAPSLASSTSSTRTTAKIRAGIRRIFGAPSAADSPAIASTSIDSTSVGGVQVQHHAAAAAAAPPPQPEAVPLRMRTGSVASAFLPRTRAGSVASTTPSVAAPALQQQQPVGELFLDLRVERRAKRRATFILPAVNQEQVALRGGAHVEMAVVLEYGVLVRESAADRERREAVARRAETEAAWAAADARDRTPVVRSPLSVFTRSGRLSTWRR